MELSTVEASFLLLALILAIVVIILVFTRYYNAHQEQLSLKDSLYNEEEVQSEDFFTSQICDYVCSLPATYDDPNSPNHPDHPNNLKKPKSAKIIPLNTFFKNPKNPL